MDVWTELCQRADWKYGKGHDIDKMLAALDEECDWNGVCGFCGEDVGEVFNHIQQEIYCSKCAQFFQRGNNENL